MTKEGLTQRIRLGTPDKRLLVVTAHVWTLISKIVSCISLYLKPNVTTQWVSELVYLTSLLNSHGLMSDGPGARQ